MKEVSVGGMLLLSDKIDGFRERGMLGRESVCVCVREKYEVENCVLFCLQQSRTSESVVPPLD